VSDRTGKVIGNFEFKKKQVFHLKDEHEILKAYQSKPDITIGQVFFITSLAESLRITNKDKVVNDHGVHDSSVS
jgi:hypothetical protein